MTIIELFLTFFKRDGKNWRCRGYEATTKQMNVILSVYQQ